MMDCKKALMETQGDMEKAIEVLRERGIAAAEKKVSRIAAEGIVDAYIHMGGKVGVLVEINCETDFVAKTDEFRTLVKDITMQIAAMNPIYISKDVPTEVLEKEKEVLRVQALNEGKPEKVVEKIVEGRIDKFYKENCLLEQAFIKDEDKTVGELIIENIAKIGEKISVRRFARFVLGEGLEKRSDNLAAAVEEQLQR